MKYSDKSSSKSTVEKVADEKATKQIKLVTGQIKKLSRGKPVTFKAMLCGGWI